MGDSPPLPLALRPTEIPTGTPLPDDHTVVAAGRPVGRIMKVQRAGGTGRGSRRSFSSSAADLGDAETLDAAKAAFRARGRGGRAV